jgi:hypothetical protein
MRPRAVAGAFAHRWIGVVQEARELGAVRRTSVLERSDAREGRVLGLGRASAAREQHDEADTELHAQR